MTERRIGNMENPVKTIPIAEGILLEIHDLSRNLTKDIWEIKLLFRAKIPVEEKLFTAEDLRKYRIAELTEALGPSVVFEVVRERKFVREKDRNESFQSLVDDFLKNSGSYLLQPGFCGKFVLRKFHESQKGSIP